MGKKDPAVQILGICTLIACCCLLLQITEVQRGRQSLLLNLSSLRQTHAPLAEVTSGELQGQCPYSSLPVSLFSPFLEVAFPRLGYSKETTYMG